MQSASFDGFGLGLRQPHYAAFIEGRVPVDFVEVISENFMVEGGRPRHVLRAVREHYPVALHGVSMSVGSTDGIDQGYLRRLRALADEIDPLFVSDHLCWTRVAGFNSHDLLPLPFSEDVLELVVETIAAVQDVLGRHILIENPSSYMSFAQSTMSEPEFLAALCKQSGCELLLDINNVFVSAQNNRFDPIEYLDSLPLQLVRQVHLAGHSQGEVLLIDTHDAPVCTQVWDLFAHVAPRLGPVAVMIERDDAIPELDALLRELDTARHVRDASRCQSL